MNVFNIFKPDMLNDEFAIDYYFELLEFTLKIKVGAIYQICNWIDIARYIYELDIKNQLLSPVETMKKRREILVTIMGYKKYFSSINAHLVIYDTKDLNIEILKKMWELKKELRKKFVDKTDQYFISFLNEEEIDFSLPLDKIELDRILVETIVKPYFEENEDSKYQMAFFNKLHCPDPKIEIINREFQCLTDHGVICEENKVMRLKK